MDPALLREKMMTDRQNESLREQLFRFDIVPRREMKCDAEIQPARPDRD